MDENLTNQINHLLLVAVPLLFSLSFHEAAHAWMANRRGDDTAKSLGRLSLNPLVHIDLFGTIILPLIMYFFHGPLFGWAKPVPVNPLRLRSYRRDNLLIALAGPVSNVLLAVVFALIFRLLIGYQGALSHTEGVTGLRLLEPLLLMFYYAVAMNLALALFNLLPLPALDGSHILAGLLPEAWAAKIDSYQRYSLLIFVLLLSTGVLRYLSIPIHLGLALLTGGLG